MTPQQRERVRKVYTLAGGTPLAAPADWTSALTWDDGILSLAVPAMIDVGALGKGRLVDLVLELLRAQGAGSVVVDAGGDLAVRGAPQRIGLEPAMKHTLYLCLVTFFLLFFFLLQRRLELARTADELAALRQQLAELQDP